MSSSPTIADVRQWEIWQVYWDHGDGTGKDRTALAITTSTENASGTAIFVKITKQDHPNVPCRVKIDKSDPHFKHTGLTQTSWIHCLDDNPITNAELRFRRGTISPFTAAYLKILFQKLAAGKAK